MLAGWYSRLDRSPCAQYKAEPFASILRQAGFHFPQQIFQITKRNRTAIFCFFPSSHHSSPHDKTIVQ